MPRIVWRVVCGREDVIAILLPTSALVSVDLPVLGRPTKHTKPERNSFLLMLLLDHGSIGSREDDGRLRTDFV